MKNLNVILGAGASTGSVKHGETSQHPIIPPVTKNLFSTAYESILRKYGDVQTNTIGFSSVNNDGKSLEDQVKEELGTFSVYESLPAHRKRALNQLPLYLQDLFSDISKQLKNSTYYSRFVYRIFDYIDKNNFKVTFITLNYDLLLDYAIERVLNKKFDSFGNYSDDLNRWMLVKPHGSVNWFRQITNYTQSGNTHESWKVIVRNLNILKDVSDELRFVNLDEFQEGFINGVPHYPALSIPNTDYSPIYPIGGLEDLLGERLAECENFLIIGFSAYDQDLLDLLKKHIKKVRGLLIVGLENVDQVYGRLKTNVPVFLVKKPEEVLYGRGFGHFVNSADMTNFLNTLVIE